MSFKNLRRTVATLMSEEADDQYIGPDVPAHLNEAPPLQPRHPDYTHCVLFDPDRFPTDEQRDKLLKRVSRRYSKRLKWCLDPVSAATLHGRVHIYSAFHTRQFLKKGYVAEIQAPRFWPPQRSVRCQQAWDAFYVHALIVEAIISSCHKLPASRKRNLIFPNPLTDALTPICGLSRKKDKTRGTNVLSEFKGVLVAPRTFHKRLTGYPALAVTPASAFKAGRAKFASFYAPTRLAIRRRMDLEVKAWSDFLGDKFSIDGLILHSTQTLALLRVQATERSYREERGYLASGTKLAKREKKAQATKGVHSIEYLQVIEDGLRDDLRAGTTLLIPNMKRPRLSLLADVKSILAGGTGLEDEAIWRDDQTLREAYSPQLLETVAVWISELKRRQRATLTEFMATLIEEILTGELDHLDELTDEERRTALKLVRSQFPDAIWREMLNIAINSPEHVNEIEVRYRWNANPVERIAIERDGDSIVIVGPLINLRAFDHSFWTDRAELFRSRRTITV